LPLPLREGCCRYWRNRRHPSERDRGGEGEQKNKKSSSHSVSLLRSPLILRHPTRDNQSGQTSELEFEFVFVGAHLKPDSVSRDTYFPPDTMSREKELVSRFTLCLALLAYWSAPGCCTTCCTTTKMWPLFRSASTRRIYGTHRGELLSAVGYALRVHRQGK
jgi:hypothetical protein